MVASEAGLAYGTFYRHFRDLAHVVRDAMVRETANLESHGDRFSEPLADAAAERAKLVAWIREAIAAVLPRPGLFRAWHVTRTTTGPSSPNASAASKPTSTAWPATSAACRRRASPNPRPRSRHMRSSRWSGPATREAAIDKAFSEAKHEGIISVVTDLAGL